MLFIYGSLALGGIETFFVRMAKARAAMGMKTKILLLKNKERSNPELLDEMGKYAEVYYLEDFVFLPKLVSAFIPYHLLLVIPLRKELRHVFDDVRQVHVSSGALGFFYLRVSSLFELSIPLTIGVYHSREFIWGAGGDLPFYERTNRHLFSKFLSRENLIFFNERLVSCYEEAFGHDMVGVNVFPLGVTSSNARVDIGKRKKSKSKDLVIGSIGRLVDFKTYNLWMIDVVHDLIKRGISVRYVIYGDGPLRADMIKKIEAYGLLDRIELRGLLEYSKFTGAISEFDIFIGSGTAIVEAAGQGVPSLIGIESVDAPVTYGFLSEIPGFTYNEDNLYTKNLAVDKIFEFINMDCCSRTKISYDHISKADIFSIETCVQNFNGVKGVPFDGDSLAEFSSFYFRLKYSISFFIFSLLLRVRGKALSEVVYG
ncbi:hypothetical protein ACSX1C_07210 [Pseudomonas sp. MBLB4123]|uniref:hypothetical protein n=1 Tax=Pseudomonas sp. MBLB4123 TaxID=3451557 RepID=UPI003F74EB40